ncbi:MAG: aldehyde dehydrogenase family protein [Anaerolineales bacterium]|nr:MAG: aldehyde dehydrogenase family protein [Anaerolineales bacterium]
MLDQTRIEQIVEQVMSELRQGERVRSGPTPEVLEPTTPPPPAPIIKHGGNLFQDVDRAVSAGRLAYEQLNALPLSIREQMIHHIRRTMRENAQLLAYEAWQETGMGRYEDKIEKNLLNANKAAGTEILEPRAWTGDGGLTLVEYAPYGLIGSIIPSTNPTSTVICNSISMIAAGNAIVFNAHPSAENSSNHTIQLVNDAIIEAGGPANLVTGIENPTIETAQEIMAHKSVNLLTVTGGAAVVRQAMGSGKRAICAGPGNPPVVVDETADLEQAGRDIVRGGSFDNNIICTDEKGVFVVQSVADELKRAMSRHGAIEIDLAQFDQLKKSIFLDDPSPGHYATMNKDFIGKNAGILLAEIGIQAGDEIRMVFVEVPPDHPLVFSEQMMPIMPVVRMRNADEAIDLAKKSEHGFRHTRRDAFQAARSPRPYGQGDGLQHLCEERALLLRFGVRWRRLLRLYDRQPNWRGHYEPGQF